MISLSKVIKASHVISLDDKVVIQPAKYISPSGEGTASFLLDAEGILDNEHHEFVSEAQSLKDRIVSDAEASAEAILDEAAAAAETLKQAAQTEIHTWWVQKREEDLEQAERARQEGYQIGHQEGYSQAEDSVRAQYANLIENAKSIIEQAGFIKQQMILEAEPFLIELSCAIAEKIIGRQLTMEPEWIVDSISKVLQRKREQGVISLCVSPSQFAFIQDAREELMLSIDSQAELQVLPDPSVNDFGCVVRSSFGSIDARIDTQLEEIKEALLQLFRRSEGTPQDE
jgi:flagellar assembly protein FliH